MKNKILLLATFLVISTVIQARTPRVKNRVFNYETIKLPQMALPEHRTYSLSLETSADYGNLAARYMSALQIPGWVKQDNGAYELDVKLFPVDYAGPKIIERHEYIKDTAGVVIDTVRFFRNVYKAVANGSLGVYNEANQTVYSNMLRTVRLQMTGKEFSNRRVARKHRFREANRLQRQMSIDFMHAMSGQVNKRLDGLLGIYPIRKSASLMIVRNRKHVEYSKMQSFWNSFSSKVVHVDQHTDLTKFEMEIETEIAYLKSIETKYRGRKKADRKIRYMAYRNLSTIYEMLEMPNEAIYYAQKIRSNDFRKFNANYLVADAQRMKRLQRIHGM